MKVLDTTFLIDYLDGDKQTPKVVSGNEEFLTTQLNMYELIRGIFLTDNPQSNLLKAKKVFETLRILTLDDNGIIESARIFADLSKTGKMIPDSDCLTAGIALSNGINKIVTRNKDHFARINGIVVETY
jgi:tRNA(fMet)-specific endonuclease VapC